MYFGAVSSESLGRICKIYALNIQNLADKTKKNLMYLCDHQWLMPFSGVTRIEEIFKDGRYELDNNLIENKIRPLALGRKNYLFAGSHEAALRNAMMYSFFACCDAHGLNPTEWLTQTINRIADTKMSELESLLPHSAPAQ